MKALIDADLVSFIAAASAEQEVEAIAISRTNNFVDTILERTESSVYQLYLSGESNFRYSVFPEYKRNRDGAYRPRHQRVCIQFLKDVWGAKVYSDHLEADDALGIEQTDDTIICSIDKDMLMIPGWHYSWAIWRKGKEIRPEKKQYVSGADGLRNFYTQLLVGDPSDGIKGAQGIGKVKAAGILQGCNSHYEYVNACRPYFSCDEEMEMNAKVLWIWQKNPDNIIDRWKEAGYQATVSETEGEDRAAVGT